MGRVRYPDYDPDWRGLGMVRVMAGWPPIQPLNAIHRELVKKKGFKALGDASHVLLRAIELLSKRTPSLPLDALGHPRVAAETLAQTEQCVASGWLVRTDDGEYALGPRTDGLVRIIRDVPYPECWSEE